MSYDYYGYFRHSTPRAAKGGIKARSRRGEFGQSWWAKRWIKVLNDSKLGARLGRGMSYARRGQVLSVDVQNGSVTASVQGSRRRPYRVEIKVNTLDMSDWERLTRTLFARPAFAAKLLAGQMPENIEGVFRDAGLSLFPDKRADLDTDCTCPDWSNPCKHIAAVYLLLGEEFDRDPFLVFKLRGAEREELLDMAGLRPMAGMAPAGRESTPGPLSGQATDSSPPEPLPPDRDEFWGQASREGEDSPGLVQIPTIPATLPKRLGSFPFWRGEESFIPAMEEIYRNASSAGLDIFLGERQGLDAKRTAGHNP